MSLDKSVPEPVEGLDHPGTALLVLEDGSRVTLDEVTAVR